MKTVNHLGTDPIGKLVPRIAFPSMLAQFVSVLYSIVDRMYIGHIASVGDLALAGVGVCGPILTMIGAFSSLIGFDTIGTTIMSSMAKGASLLSPHGITGALAIILMLFHAIWATVVFKGQERKKLENFHKFSIVVWLIWLIPYVLGVFIGMAA